MRDSASIAVLLSQEAQILYRAYTGRVCPDDIAVYYGAWVSDRMNCDPILPSLIRRFPWILSCLAPLQGSQPEFDARRSAMMTLAESHPHSAELFYQYEAMSWYKAVTILAMITFLEILKLPLRALASRYLWA